MVAIPQDEYANSKRLWRILNEYKVKSVFTCADGRDQKVLYPKNKVGVKNFIKVFPGYVDEATLSEIEDQGWSSGERSIDIGYRSRRLPYWFGRYAQNKAKVGEVIKKYCEEHTDLEVDISSDLDKVLYGDEWVKFLCRCNVVLGVESGTSLMYKDWGIRERVESYLEKNPRADYEEVERACFPGEDGNISLLTVGPRVFEAAMTKTCQILLEGDYAGVVKPGVHYVELKKDYSNLEEVIEKVKDEDYRNKIVERAYKDLVLSGRYSFRVFINRVVENLRALRNDSGRVDVEGEDDGLMIRLFPLWLWLHLSVNRVRLVVEVYGGEVWKWWKRVMYIVVIRPGSSIKQRIWPGKLKRGRVSLKPRRKR
jgi:hypothetical protein